MALECRALRCGANPSEDVPVGVALVSDGVECAAHVLSSHWLIASAHCLRNFTVNNTLVVARDQPSGKVNHIRAHPHYSLFRSLRFPDFDLALVHTQDVQNTSRAVCLPPHAIDAQITCLVPTRAGDVPYEVVDAPACNSSKHFNASLTGRHLCARTQTRQCVGVGSPLMCLSSASEWYIAGFVSYEHNCRGLHPTVFSNVFNMKHWLRAVIGWETYGTHQSMYIIGTQLNSTLNNESETLNTTQTNYNSTQL